MTKGDALLKLLEATGQLGFDSELIEVNNAFHCGEKTDDLVVAFKNFRDHPEVSIQVTISEEFWRYPGTACYFVNYSHKAGDFSACQGTPHLAKALFDLGDAFANANSTLLRLGQIKKVA